MFIAFVYACVFKNVNKLGSGTRVHTEIPGGECHRHGKGIRKEMKRLGAFVVFGVLVWMLADTQTNHGSSNVHAQWFSRWKIRADNNDVLI